MIPAGRSGKLVAKVHTKSTQNATLRKSISVFTDCEEAKSLRLSMAFTVESPITIRPRPLIYFNGTIGKEQSTRLLFHSNDGKALKIEKIRFDDPAIKLSAEAFDPQVPVPAGFKPEQGDVWLVARLNPGVEAGVRKTKAWITTSNSKAGEIEIPVNLLIRARIEAHPAELRFWVEDSGGGVRSTTFRLTNTAETMYTISSIEVADPELVEVSVVDPKPSQVHSISVKLLDGVGPAEVKKGLESQIIFHTTDPLQPLVQVPLRILPRKAITRPLNHRPAQLRKKPVFTPRPLPTGTPRPYPTGTPHPA